jgi:hypothetical protein
MLETTNHIPNPASMAEHIPNTTLFTFCVHKRLDLNTTQEIDWQRLTPVRLSGNRELHLSLHQILMACS